MAIALVGSLGTVATGSTSCSPTFAQATTAGNFIVAWSASNGTAPSTPSGWTAGLTGSPGATCQIFYKEDCSASEAAPTFSYTGGTVSGACLAEFSGVVTSSSLDETLGGTQGSNSSPFTLTANAPDIVSGELIIGVSYLFYTMAATKTTSHSYNNGTQVAVGNNDSTSAAGHFRFSYAITTTNASADALTATFTTTSISSNGHRIATFTVPPIPSLVMAPHRAAA
jgi:hypothetical protein